METFQGFLLYVRFEAITFFSFNAAHAELFDIDAVMAAVKEGKVLKMPSSAESWDSPVPSSVLGSVWLSSKLHPETTSEDFAKEVINEYYETFYGFTYPEQ